MRPRVHASSTVPEGGPRRASSSVIVTWDEGADLRDVEEAVKQSAREAITRVRDVAAPRRPQAPYEQILLPSGT